MAPRFVTGWLVVVALLATALATTLARAQEHTPKKVEVTGLAVDSDNLPLADVTIQALTWSQLPEPMLTDRDGRFRLSLRLYDEDRIGEVYLLAQAPDGRAGFLIFDELPARDFPVVLRTGRPLAVHVQDRDGKPVAQAPVHLLVNNLLLVQAGTTDDRGDWRLNVPDNLSHWSIVAYKSQVGLDYAQARRGPVSLEPEYPLPDKLTLQLDGSRTARFRVVDHQQRPVAGVQLYPWSIHKPNQEAPLNLNRKMVPKNVTDHQGMVSIDYLPKQFESSISLGIASEDFYHPQQSLTLSADAPDDEVTLQVLPNEKLTGRVTLPDGKPALGAKVAVLGTGINKAGFGGMATADADGNYELSVSSEHQYIVQAFYGELISPFRTDVVVRAGKPIAGVDLVVGEPVRVRGKVTRGKSRQPAPHNTLVMMLQAGEVTAELPRPPGSPKRFPLQRQTAAVTNAAGEYEFRLTPGDYYFHCIGAQPTTVKLSSPATAPVVTFDFHLTTGGVSPLAGKVVDREGRPIANAFVSGQYATNEYHRRDPRAKTDAAGMFRIERSHYPMVFYARASDKDWAGVGRCGEDDQQTTSTVAPMGSAAGTLCDQAGKIAADQELTYGIKVYRGEPGRSAFTFSYGGQAKTDAEGRFHLPNLVLGEEYHLNVQLTDSSSRTATTLTVNDNSPLKLGELKVDTKPASAYVPPTPAEKAQAAFMGRRDTPPEARLARVLDEAKREYTRPLVLVGRPDAKACIELFRLFEERDQDQDEKTRGKQNDYVAPNELRWEFELLALDNTHAPIAEYVRRRELAPVSERPMLVSLDNDGNVVDTLPLKDDKLNPREIGAWLEKYKLPTRNAGQSYQAALEKAKAEDKRVFLIFSASWCGPCRMLSRFLASYKTELEQHFVFVKLDISRDEGARDLQDQFPESQRSGVPWFCIVDAEGKSLINSTVPQKGSTSGGGNMGFPTLAPEVEYFGKLLQIGAPRLSADKIQEMKAQLLKKP